FTNGRALLTFVNQQVIPNVNTKPSGVKYFVTYDINPFAPVYRDLNNNGVQDSGEAVGLGALISNATSFIVITPDLVSAPRSMFTKNATLSEYPDLVTFVPDTTITPTYATQGDKDVPIMKFSMGTNVSLAQFNSLKISRVGAGPIQTQGSNDDIALVKIYRDV